MMAFTTGTRNIGKREFLGLLVIAAGVICLTACARMLGDDVFWTAAGCVVAADVAGLLLVSRYCRREELRVCADLAAMMEMSTVAANDMQDTQGEYPAIQGLNEDSKQNRNNEEQLSEGIEKHMSDSSYRFKVEEGERYYWHKREMNLVFEEAAGSNRLKKELVRNIAHEVKTPLTSLQLVAEGLEDGIFTVDDGTSINQIKDSVKRLNATVKMMSEYVQQGAAAVDGQTSDLAACLSEAYAKAQQLAKARNMEVEIRQASNMDDTRMLVDFPSQELDRVIECIVSNAFDHARGMKTLAFSVSSERHPLHRRSMAKISVTDDGCGAPGAMANRMYEPFWKMDESHKLERDKVTSPGLGLSIVKELVVGRGGEVAIDCEEGRGMRVSLWLPISSASGNSVGSEMLLA